MPWFPVFSAFLAPRLPNSSPYVRRVEKTKFEKNLEGVRSRPGIRFIPFAVTGFGSLGGHATVLLTELARHAAFSKEVKDACGQVVGLLGS
jgi:hypothetical protein